MRETDREHQGTLRERARRGLGALKRARGVRIAALCLGALYATYLLVANALLGFHWLDRIVTTADGTVEMHIGRGWSVWPGRVHLRDFALRLDGEDQQVRVSVARATTSLSLWRLLRREIRLDHVRADDVSFRLRMRVEAITADNAERVAAYPDIPGALGPPTRAAAPNIEPEPVDKRWHVDLRDVDVLAREVWIQEYRLEGLVHAHGGFALWPGKSLVVAETSTTVAPALVHVGERTLTRDFTLERSRTHIAEVALDSATAATVLEHLQAAAEGRATLDDASFLDVYAAHGVPRVRASPTDSSFDLRFAAGRFLRGSKALVNVPEGSATATGLSVRGALVVRVDVENDGDLGFGLDASQLALTIASLPSTQKAPWTLHELSLRQQLHVAVGDPVEAGLGAYQGELRTPTLGWFEDVSELGVKTRGNLHASAKLTRGGDGRIRGPWHAELHDAHVSSDSLTFRGEGSARGELLTEKNPAQGVRLSATRAELPQVSMQARGAEPRASWVRIDVPSASWASEPQSQIRLNAALAAANSGPVAAYVNSAAGEVLGPIAARFVQKPGLRADLSVATLESNVTVRMPRARLGDVDVVCKLSKQAERTRLHCALSQGTLSMGVRIEGGVPMVLPNVGPEWLAAQ